MKQSKAHHYLALLQAWAAGKTLQTSNPNGKVWTDVKEDHDISFSMSIERYRIKPETKTVPLTQKDFMTGQIWWIRQKNHPAFIQQVTHINPDYAAGYLYDKLHREFERSTDQKNWFPCSKTIEE